MAKRPGAVERMPRRPPPEFRGSEESVFTGVIEDGFLNVALDDANQFGPHAMIMLLFAFATVTALALLVIPFFANLF